jgi:hypothetical protein
VKEVAEPAVVAVVALVAFPERVAVMVPAEKLPLASRFTIVFAVEDEVAELAAETPEAIELADCPPTEPTTVEDCVPVTSPERLPVKDVDEVAEVAFPAKLAVITLAEKLPFASLRTMRLAVAEAVAEFAALAPDATEDAERPPTEDTTVADWVPVTSPVKFPVKEAAEFADVAFPDKFAVTTLAAKLPFESRITIRLGVLVEVEAFANPAPEATDEAERPPTWETTVED